MFLTFILTDVLQAQNFDLDNICTPINTANFGKLLQDTKYDREKTDFILNGFKKGFSLHYIGPTNRTDTSRNLRLNIGSELELWNKVMNEVKLKRYAGPFSSIPVSFKDSFVQSPLGLVKKAGFTEDGKPKTRLIFHLSHPRISKTSINDYTDERFKHVKYKDLDHAVRICLQRGRNCYMAKTGTIK